MFEREYAEKAIAAQAAGQCISKADCKEPTILESIDEQIRRRELQIEELKRVREILSEPNGFLKLTRSQLNQVMNGY